MTIPFYGKPNHVLPMAHMISTIEVSWTVMINPESLGGVRTLPLSMAVAAVAAVAVAAGRRLPASGAAAVEASPQAGWPVSNWNPHKK